MVRSKGVMEKCTLCLQRVQGAKDRAAVLGREVRDGELTTACAEACPAKAIVVGNLRDAGSRVSELTADPRSYIVFNHLYTRPGVSYLKAIEREV